MFHSSIATHPARPRVPTLRLWRDDLLRFWPIWLVAAAGVIVRIYGIDRFPGIIGDEGWYGVQVQRLLLGEGAAWRTPTGNVPGLIQYGSLALLHSLFAPSALLLRLPALISSLSAIALAYIIARKYIGSTAGMMAVALMACLPINIAYARLGWDPSHTGLLVLLATFAAMEGRAPLSALAFAFAMANHPSAAFAAPFLAFAFLGADVDRGPWRRAVVRASAFAAMLAAAGLVSLLTAPNAGGYLNVSRSIARLADGSAYAEYALLFSRLLSGDSIYQFLVGAGYGAKLALVDALALLAVAAVLFGGLVALLRRPHFPTLGLVAGWLAALGVFFIVVGPWGMRPSLERFSIALVPPTVLAMAALADRMVLGFRLQKIFPYAITALGGALLASFVLFYAQPLERGEQRPGTGIRIGLPALNQPAFKEILRRAGPMQARIIVEDSWIYWPTLYRAEPGRFFIVRARDAEESETMAFPGGTWWITYRGSELDRRLWSAPDLQRSSTVEAPDRRQALNIWRRR